MNYSHLIIIAAYLNKFKKKLFLPISWIISFSIHRLFDYSLSLRSQHKPEFTLYPQEEEKWSWLSQSRGWTEKNIAKHYCFITSFSYPILLLYITSFSVDKRRNFSCAIGFFSRDSPLFGFGLKPSQTSLKEEMRNWSTRTWSHQHEITYDRTNITKAGSLSIGSTVLIITWPVHSRPSHLHLIYFQVVIIERRSTSLLTREFAEIFVKEDWNTWRNNELVGLALRVLAVVAEFIRRYKLLLSFLWLRNISSWSKKC